MGGCRCYFRDCQVTTLRNPGMHFFRFPLRDPERMKKWIKMADAKHILDLKADQQKNRMICGRHFPDEHFMNYKKDSLVGSAVPTLTRLSVNYALDYVNCDETNNPILVQLHKPTQRHLLAPTGFKCPLGLEDNAETDKRILEKYVDFLQLLPEENIVISEEIDVDLDALYEKNQMTKQNTLYINMLQQKEEYRVPAKKQKIQNYRIDFDATNGLESDGTNAKIDDFEHVNILLTQTELDEELSNDHKQTIECVDAFTQTEPNQHKQQLQQLQRQHRMVCCQLKSSKETLVIEKAKYAELNKKYLDLQTEHELMEKQTQKLSESEHLQLKSKDEQTKQLKQLQFEHQQLQMEMYNLQQQYKQALQQNRESSITESKVNSEDVSTVTTSSLTKNMNVLSKTQLFSTIKKYLSSSMVSLLRMEMFGNADREWKPDEQRTAVDLFRLGENVYKYFIDEWRLRLPVLRQVRLWSTEGVVFDEED